MTDATVAEPGLALPTGYSILTLNRETRGGGIAVIFKSCHRCLFVKEDVAGCECACFVISFSAHSSFTGLLVYRPPGPISAFKSAIIEAVSSLALTAANFSLIGDLNIHFDHPSDSEISSLVADFAACQLRQLVIGPTHTAGHLLDPVFSNLHSLLVKTPSPVCWSDHFLVSISLPLSESVSRVDPRATFRRCWHKLKLEDLHAILTSCPPIPDTDPEQAYKLLCDWILFALDTLIPAKWSKGRCSSSNPWYNDSLATLRRACKKLERVWRREYNLGAKKSYQDAIKQYHKAIHLARGAYLTNEIKSSKNPVKSIFKILNDFKTRKDPSTPVITSGQQCEDLATFFVQKVEAIINPSLYPLSIPLLLWLLPPRLPWQQSPSSTRTSFSR